MTENPQVLAAAPELGSSALDAVLGQLRLDGAIFFRTELTDPFSFESTPLALADALRPGADRLILFHIVAEGTCWVEGDDGLRHLAEAGDVIVLPYGDHHVIGGAGEAEVVPIVDLVDPLPWHDLPAIRHGGGGRRTDLVCGYLVSDDPLFDPSLRALPPVFVVRLPPGPATRWVQASISYAVEHTVPSDRSANRLATRLPELVLIDVLRAHLVTAPAGATGFLAALRDPVLAPALALLHRSPGAAWTVTDLAAQAAVSRSLLDSRFRTVLGRSPIRYLTEWRMRLAEDLLTGGDMSVNEIGRRVGYRSEDAFSRAFKRERGLSPRHWRDDRSGVTASSAPSSRTGGG